MAGFHVSLTHESFCFNSFLSQPLHWKFLFACIEREKRKIDLLGSVFFLSCSHFGLPTFRFLYWYPLSQHNTSTRYKHYKRAAMPIDRNRKKLEVLFLSEECKEYVLDLSWPFHHFIPCFCQTLSLSFPTSSTLFTCNALHSSSREHATYWLTMLDTWLDGRDLIHEPCFW